jgi:hypothetical protein
MRLSMMPGGAANNLGGKVIPLRRGPIRPSPVGEGCGGSVCDLREHPRFGASRRI